MSNFNLAIPIILENEGGLVNDQNDKGGITNFGISLRWLKTINKLATPETIKNLTKEEASNLYYTYWWKELGYSNIISQKIANKIFDLSVNQGNIQSHKLLQRALWAMYGYQCVKDDGILGMKTINKVNSTLDDNSLLNSLKSEAAGLYRLIIKQNPYDIKYLDGWLKRAYQ